MNLPKSFAQFSLALLAGLGSLTLFTPQPSWAQTSEGAATLQPTVSDAENSSDPFANNARPSAMFDIMHRFQQGDIRSTGEFMNDQRQYLDEAAAEFRKLQLLRLQESSSASEVTPTPSPNP